MEIWQRYLVLFWGLSSFLIFLKGLNESKDKKNAFGQTPYLLPLGIFVWGDATVFGLFWALVSLVVLFLKDWILLLLIISVFWVIRSLGETIYWINQQFSSVNRNPPERLIGYSIFKNDSIWFIYQIVWQCVAVISVIFSIYFAKIWLL